MKFGSYNLTTTEEYPLNQRQFQNLRPEETGDARDWNVVRLSDDNTETKLSPRPSFHSISCSSSKCLMFSETSLTTPESHRCYKKLNCMQK